MDACHQQQAREPVHAVHAGVLQHFTNVEVFNLALCPRSIWAHAPVALSDTGPPQVSVAELGRAWQS